MTRTLAIFAALVLAALPRAAHARDEPFAATVAQHRDGLLQTIVMVELYERGCTRDDLPQQPPAGELRAARWIEQRQGRRSEVTGCWGYAAPSIRIFWADGTTTPIAPAAFVAPAEARRLFERATMGGAI